MADDRSDREDDDAHGGNQDQSGVQATEVETVAGLQERGGEAEACTATADDELGDDGADQREAARNLEAA